ncbi:structure-specific endonuclease subunit slx1 isoform X2 [Cucurbita maxima]|uniref:Structure-specific endonuclease subunit slx1 isoform X2 n=1 Tax=Cucurbita maxima TaxID=3661 RepID=A0A6J1K8A7_CUCMA|nr:structure-specific endonuclease subunit slx1 isoform X2 [Cucurbita maxima]
MVLCIYGFPTQVSALQFGWAWQHPSESLAVRSAAAGVANKVKLAYTMLTLPARCSLNITINYISTKYMKNTASCSSLPEHMKVQVSLINELPCYSEGDQGELENKELEEMYHFQVYGSMKVEIPRKSMDYQTVDMSYDLHGCGKELESPPCSPSYIVAVMSGAEMINEYEEDRLEGIGMNLQQQQPGRKRNLTS